MEENNLQIVWLIRKYMDYRGIPKNNKKTNPIKKMCKIFK